MDIPEIDIELAQELFESGSAVFVDIRDANSFHAARVPGAIHLNESTVKDFVANTDKQATVVVYCYHGNSSRGATAFLQDQGFAAAASLTGGFTAWHAANGAATHDAPSDP